jgi:methyltransferase family protein
VNDATRQAVLYGNIWKEDPTYGTAARDVYDTVVNRIAPHMARLGIVRPRAHVIDFGAGDGRFLQAMWENSYLGRGTGIDVYRPDYQPAWMDWRAQPMWEPAISEGDYAISTDALEHLPPDRVNEALDSIHNAAPHGFLRISLKEDKYGMERGLHLHESVFSSGEWMGRLGSAGIWPTSYKVYLDNPVTEAALEVWF